MKNKFVGLENTAMEHNFTLANETYAKNRYDISKFWSNEILNSFEKHISM